MKSHTPSSNAKITHYQYGVTPDPSDDVDHELTQDLQLFD